MLNETEEAIRLCCNHFLSLVAFQLRGDPGYAYACGVIFYDTKSTFCVFETLNCSGTPIRNEQETRIRQELQITCGFEGSSQKPLEQLKVSRFTKAS